MFSSAEVQPWHANSGEVRHCVDKASLVSLTELLSLDSSNARKAGNNRELCKGIIFEIKKKIKELWPNGYMYTTAQSYQPDQTWSRKGQPSWGLLWKGWYLKHWTVDLVAIVAC